MRLALLTILMDDSGYRWKSPQPELHQIFFGWM